MKYRYVLIDFFDSEADKELQRDFSIKLERDMTFTINDVTYAVEHAEHYNAVDDVTIGKAIVKMVRYRISDTATSFVHKCPVKKSSMEKLDRDDVLKLETKFGKKGATKRIKAWKTGRTKLQSYNKLESKCPLCQCVFWKKHNRVPETVVIDGVMHKKGLKK